MAAAPAALPHHPEFGDYCVHVVLPRGVCSLVVAHLVDISEETSESCSFVTRSLP